MIPKLLIRADAGGSMGTGHVMRMIALAQAYRRRGGAVTLASVRCPKALVQRVKDCGLEHRFIEVEDEGSPADAHATVAIAKEINARWIVLDGYQFGYDYQKKIKEHGHLLLCVDDYDYAKEWHCDAILNQNLDAEIERHYTNDIRDARYLLGSSFCLLRQEFLNSRKALTKWNKIERLLVTLGGSDPDNATETTLRLLNSACERPLTVRVLSGVDNPHLERLKAFKSHHSIDVLTNVSDMSTQYEWADGVVSAGGSTCWEWLHAGLPGAVVTIADNQVPIVRALTEHRKAALSLGWFRDIKQSKQGNVLASWLEAPDSETDEDAALTLIDGFGADRVAAMLDGSFKINVITADGGWLASRLGEFKKDLELLGHQVCIVNSPDELGSGDILLILSYWGLLSQDVLSKHTHNLVVHESALPSGKGWSPLTWQVLEGKSEIPVTLFEAVKKVDAGSIYATDSITLDGTELIDEIRDKQAEKTFDLCKSFVNGYPGTVAAKRGQIGEESFYPRRRPEDSVLDPEKTIADQFNLLRVVDNKAYPAFFDHKGSRYILKIEKEV